jgi:Fe2+ or Zn2+ uptake regulation protein
MFEKYVKLLKINSIKITPQRLEILKYLDKNRNHPTVEKIYKDLKTENPSLSKTTIYNSLDTLYNHGIIQSITISKSELRYDLKQGMHHHFLCKKCGRISDIDIKCPNLGKIINIGHKVEEVHGYFKGICKNCYQKEINKK